MSMFRSKPHRPLITLLFKELLAEIVGQQPDLELGIALLLACKEAGMDPDQVDLEALAVRLQPKDDEKPKGPRRKGNGFGAKFTEWVEGLKSDQLCLWAADYDLEKARKLYCEVDIDDLRTIFDMKIGQTWQDYRTRYEACLLGFGGKLEGQSDATVHEVDMSNTESVNSMIEHMKKLGL